MNDRQFAAMMGILREIRDLLPVQEKPEPIVIKSWGSHEPVASIKPYDPDDLLAPLKASMLDHSLRESLTAAASATALRTFLTVLDGWIDGARVNHYALGHRDEPIGEECWRSFTPDDIRTMVDDAARDHHLPPFVHANPRMEDRAR